MQEILSIKNELYTRNDDPRIAFGRYGEELAAEFIEKLGMRIVMSNFKVPIGRNSRGAQVTGEIDLIALDGEVLCFIEVKSRRSRTFADPLSAVNRRKQRQITRTARIYKKIFHVFEMRHRFDVVTVLAEPEKEPEIDHIAGYWRESDFRKKVWSGDIY